MNELTDLGLAEAAAGLGKRDFSAVELAQAHIAAAEKARALNAFIVETPDAALAAAAESDKRRFGGKTLGALDGIPVAIKDLFCTEGVQTTAGSRILKGFVPTYESTVTRNLKGAGVGVIGKTNLDEFAMGSSNITSAFGPVKNPWGPPLGRAGNKELVPGGSSGGSAAAVAAGLALGATGTDTGGSIRQPASFCGIVGLKPTYGRCSRFGIVAFASSLDQAGPMTRSVKDAGIMLGAMAGHDPRDSTSAPVPCPDFAKAADAPAKGLRIGIPREYRLDGMPAEIDALWRKAENWFREQGCTVAEVSLPHTRYALPTYYIIAPAEASSNLARYDGVRFGLRVPGETLDDMYMNTRAEGFGAEVRRRILIGTYVLSAGYYDAYYLKAQKVRALIAKDFRDAFETVDAILAPTAPSPAFAIGEKMEDPIAMYLNDVFTVPASLAGLPAMSVPAGLSAGGLPLGLQVIGRAFDEETVIRAGAAIERASGFDTRPSRAGRR